MIRFALVCAGQHDFEGWFQNNAGFDRQVAAGSLSCPVCGDREVRKALMTPAITRTGKGRRQPVEPAPAANVPVVATPRGAPDRGTPPPEVLARMLGTMRAIQRYVETNFDNVGKRFPEEARRIHDGRAPERGIYGEASPAEVEALADDGIEVRPLPMLPKLDS